jgi:hypothetical protein
MALHELCVLSMRMTSDCLIARGGENDRNSPEEFLPILTEACTEADLYLKLNAGDDELKKVRGDMESMLGGLLNRAKWVATRSASSLPDAYLSDPEWLRWRRKVIFGRWLLFAALVIFLFDLAWLVLVPDGAYGLPDRLLPLLAGVFRRTQSLRGLVLQVSALTAIAFAVRALVHNLLQYLAKMRANARHTGRPNASCRQSSRPMHADRREPPTPPWIVEAGLEGAFKSLSINPFLRIMMTCPNKNAPVFTGLNSSYFEEWNGNPPKDGASFVCSLCGERHVFDATNTWLEQIR